jgi:hypothetical protein
VFTQTTIEQTDPIVDGRSKVLALIGVADEDRLADGVEMIRGSSAQMDNPIYGEDLSNQVKGTNAAFNVRFFPIVDGTGKGKVTTDTSTLHVYVNGDEVNVYSVIGDKGTITLAVAPMLGDRVTVDYYFKKKDTFIQGEDLSSEVPVTPKVTLPLNTAATQTKIIIALAKPGPSGNKVIAPDGTVSGVEIKLVGIGSTDYQAIKQNGTDSLIVDLKKADGSYRTAAEVQALISNYAFSATGGTLTATLVGPVNAPCDATAEMSTARGFTGGTGQSSATTFHTKYDPIVDGSNGGVITTDTSKITVYVNKAQVIVLSVDGAEGLFTLASPVPEGSTLTVDYFTNKYQDTFDELPNQEVLEVLRCGYSPRGLDFVPDIDFVLGGGSSVQVINGTEQTVLGSDNTINWGSGVRASAFKTTPGAVPFGSNVITTQLVDTKVYSILCTGTVDGHNVEFSIPDSPMDGSGRARPTDDPSKILVYVGTNPYLAWTLGPVQVARLEGSTGKFILTTPPEFGEKVYATYYKSMVADASFNLTCVAPGPVGVGTYTAATAAGSVPFYNVETTVLGNGTNNSPDYTLTGVVWPNSKSDLFGIPGASPAEIITLTFQDDGELTQGAIASDRTLLKGPGTDQGLTLMLTLPGTTPVVSFELTQLAPATDAKAFVVTDTSVTTPQGVIPGYKVSVEITKPGGTSFRTYQDLINLFNSSHAAYPAGTLNFLQGSLQAGTDPTTPANTGVVFVGGVADVNLLGGVDRRPMSHRYKVTSSRTYAQAKIDKLGVSGGATTDPTNPELGLDGYLNCTYVDPNTGVQFTIINPYDTADAFGYTDIISNPYYFMPGQTLTISCNLNHDFVTSDQPVNFIPGCRMVVQNTMEIPSGDQALVQTFNKAGDEPNIGDIYYVTYRYAKPDSEYDLKIYYSTQENDVYTDYGFPGPLNKLALAAWLAFRNGAKVVGLLQVKRDTGFPDANDAKYAEALAKLGTLYPGMSRKPQIICPLNVSRTFLPYLKKHVETQSSIKQRGECVGFFGFANNTNPTVVKQTVESMSSERMVAIYPDGGILTISDSFGNSRDIVVDGSMLACAFAALYADPQWDTATPRTRKQLTGFKRLFRRLDPNVQNDIAQSGCTLVEQKGAAFVIRHAITTDPSNVLSIQPSITFLKDEIQQDIRDMLDPYIGKKFLTRVLTDMKTDLVSFFKSKVDAELIQTYGDITVWQDETDARVARVQAHYIPIGELAYVFVDLLIRSRA